MEKCQNLKELHVDNSTFFYGGRNPRPALALDHPSHPIQYHMFSYCKSKLESVSVKGIKFYLPGKPEKHVVGQAGLMHFVRSTPTLKWFCSDLTAENIAALKVSRPDVEFVSN